jgi:hypothetical protein
MRFIRRGETTLNEFWQDACRSKCHDMLGTIYEWCYEAVLGLKPEIEAYRTWTVKPPLRSEFKHVVGSMDCPYGLIEIEYRRDETDVVTMKITVPTSTTGFLVLPREDAVVGITRSGGEMIRRSGRRIALKPGRYDLTLTPL